MVIKHGTDTKADFWAVETIKREWEVLTSYTCSNAGLTDANKNVRRLLSPTGEHRAYYDYLPTGQDVGAGSIKTRFRFSSEEYYASQGLIMYLYRAYKISFRQWLPRDPINEAGGPNLYNFVHNNPVTRWDKWGYARTVFTKRDGSTDELENPSLTEFVDKLEAFCDNCVKVDEIWIYGHGNADSMFINDSNSRKKLGIWGATIPHEHDVIIYADGGKVSIGEYNSSDTVSEFIDITELLSCILDSDSEIYFNGCHTAQSAKVIGRTETSLAEEASRALKDVSIYGNTGFVIGVKWFTIGDAEEFVNGAHQ